MTTNLLSKASGHPDLDVVFAAYTTGTSPPATGFLVGGVDIATRYAPLSEGTQAAATGLLTEQAGHADLNQLFAAYGSLQNVIAAPGYPNLDASASGSAGSQKYTATVDIVLNANGTWSAGSTVTPTSGNWYSGAPINGVGANYNVLFTIGTLKNGVAGITISNSAATPTSLSTDSGCTISLTAGAGGSHQFQETGTINIQISNSAGTILSNVTVNIGLTVTIAAG